MYVTAMYDSSPHSPSGAIVRSEGVTASERYLGKLCRRSFLSLWSYPGVLRDQGRSNGKGDGKEVSDLLVVFENHILLRLERQRLGPQPFPDRRSEAAKHPPPLAACFRAAVECLVGPATSSRAGGEAQDSPVSIIDDIEFSCGVLTKATYGEVMCEHER